MFSINPHGSKRTPVHIINAGRNVLRQSRDLLESGAARNRVLIVRSARNVNNTEQFATSLHTLILRCRDTRQTQCVENRPRAVVLYEAAQCMAWADYIMWDETRRRVPVMLIQANDEPELQARRILVSGVCAGAHIVVYGQSSDVKKSYALLEQLHAGIGRGSCDGHANVSPGPLGLHGITSTTLYTHAVYRTRSQHTQ